MSFIRLRCRETQEGIKGWFRLSLTSRCFTASRRLRGLKEMHIKRQISATVLTEYAAEGEIETRRTVVALQIRSQSSLAGESTTPVVIEDTEALDLYA